MTLTRAMLIGLARTTALCAVLLGLLSCITHLDRISRHRRPSAETLGLVQMCIDQGYRPELVDGNRNVVCHRDDPWPSATAACEDHGGKASMRTVDGPVALVTCHDGHAELVE